MLGSPGRIRTSDQPVNRYSTYLGLQHAATPCHQQAIAGAIVSGAPDCWPLQPVAPKRMQAYLARYGKTFQRQVSARFTIMPRVKLTDRFAAGAKAAGAPQVDYFDEGTPGLALRVSSTGRKVWTFVFTSPKDDKRTRMTLGSYPAKSLADARATAIEARGYLDEKPSRDPRDLMSRTAGEMTVTDLVESYLDKHARPHLRSADEKERRFARNILPIIGAVKVSELHRRDANRVIDPVLKRNSPVEAARCFEDLRALLRWAVARGDLDRNPMDGMKKPATSRPRERVLSDEEINALWNGLPQSLPRSKASQRTIKLCLVTAQRVGEVAEMRVAELDLPAATWTIPSARTKNKHAHVVPLSPLAIEIINEALAEKGVGSDTFLFPNPEGDGPLPSSAVARTVSRAHEPDEMRPDGRFAIAHWTTHDLRRTAVSKMAEMGVSPIVLGHIINHRSVTKAGVTLSVYSHYNYAREKREALDRWAGRVVEIAGRK